MTIPKFSIITVNRNHQMGLRNTLESVRAQSCGDYEVIVIDGHSTDGSARVVEEFSDIVTLFDLDEGKGIYPAMNQGVRCASGEWVIFMNAGDIFAQACALEMFDASFESDIAFGKTRNSDGTVLEFVGWERIWTRMPVCHQSVFCKRVLLLSRPFDIRFSIVADFEFMLWAYLKNLNFRKMDYVVSEIEVTGVSGTAIFMRVWESYRAATKYFPEIRVHRFYFKKLRWAWKEQRKRRSRT